MHVSRTAALAGVAAVFAAGGAVGGYLAATPQADAVPAADAPAAASRPPAPYGPVLPADHSLATPSPAPLPVHTVTVTRVVRVPAAPPTAEHGHERHGDRRPDGHDRHGGDHHHDGWRDGHPDGGWR